MEETKGRRIEMSEKALSSCGELLVKKTVKGEILVCSSGAPEDPIMTRLSGRGSPQGEHKQVLPPDQAGGHFVVKEIMR